VSKISSILWFKLASSQLQQSIKDSIWIQTDRDRNNSVYLRLIIFFDVSICIFKVLKNKSRSKVS
jgi:hypothetical protein